MIKWRRREDERKKKSNLVIPNVAIANFFSDVRMDKKNHEISYNKIVMSVLLS